MSGHLRSQCLWASARVMVLGFLLYTFSCPVMGQTGPASRTANTTSTDESRPLPISLPYALKLANASNPTIAVAQKRVEEAYARLQAARVSWIPSLWVGGNPDNLGFLPNYMSHNGLIQNARGQMFDGISKHSSAFPVGAGWNFSIADAIFKPRIAHNVSVAERARRRSVTNSIQLDVALAFVDLQQIYGALAINAETLKMAKLMQKYASSADLAQITKTTSDINRSNNEVELREQERFELEGRAAETSAKLAQLLLLEPTVDLAPSEALILPVELVPAETSYQRLIQVALSNQPELTEGLALAGAAKEQWKEEQIRPLIPTIQAVYYDSSFGGGNPGAEVYGDRNDFMIQASWELRNAGLGNVFAAKANRSQYQQANLHLREIAAKVAADVVAAAKVSRARQRQLASGQDAIRQAETMWRKLVRGAFGLVRDRQYDPLEPLLAEQALDKSRTAYLTAVTEYNKNQFRLFWAMGQPPLDALPHARSLHVDTPVKPLPSPEPHLAAPSDRSDFHPAEKPAADDE